MSWGIRARQANLRGCTRQPAKPPDTLSIEKRRADISQLAFNKKKVSRYAGLTTAPDRIQRVQAFIRTTCPLLVTVRTF